MNWAVWFLVVVLAFICGTKLLEYLLPLAAGILLKYFCPVPGFKYHTWDGCMCTSCSQTRSEGHIFNDKCFCARCKEKRWSNHTAGEPQECLSCFGRGGHETRTVLGVQPGNIASSGMGSDWTEDTTIYGDVNGFEICSTCLGSGLMRYCIFCKNWEERVEQKAVE